ncbi:MAG: 1-acyl-sn-glycerol-3-phosphate acyltransferase [Chloroflexi bacterium]|nr:1-acyl-sn-glycerol-3-phosphate acyltransferase [Chloroflexota bacterium]
MTRERKPYNHSKLQFQRNILRWLVDQIAWRTLARIDSVQGLEHLPASGPAILMMNHIAFIDPIVVLGNLPRNIVPLAKAEVYWIPVWGVFPWLWQVIPVHRQELDRRALQSALEVLAAGEVILIAPDGTRHPALEQGKEGVAYLAYKSGVPVIPVAIGGTKGYPRFPRGSGPGATVRLGAPFRFKALPRRPNREQLRQMTDEALYVLAAMLPERRRGYYADLSKATREFILEGEG